MMPVFRSFMKWRANRGEMAAGFSGAQAEERASMVRTCKVAADAYMTVQVRRLKPSVRNWNIGQLMNRGTIFHCSIYANSKPWCNVLIFHSVKTFKRSSLWIVSEKMEKMRLGSAFWRGNDCFWKKLMLTFWYLSLKFWMAKLILSVFSDISARSSSWPVPMVWDISQEMNFCPARQRDAPGGCEIWSPIFQTKFGL